MPDQQQMMKRQQVLGDFGHFALRSENLDEVLTEACRLVGDALGTDRAKVLEIQDGRDELLVRAGVGWGPSVVGRVRLPMSERSSETFSIREAKPVVSQDINKDDRFDIPGFMKDAGVVAMVNVPIFVPGQMPYGLLQVDAHEPREFGQEDIEFLRTYATILGPVIDRLRKIRNLRTSEERFRLIVEGLPQLVFRSVGGGEWTWTSPQWTAFTGLSDAASAGDGWLAALHPDDRQQAMNAWRGAQASEEALYIEYRIRNASAGTYRWFQTRALPVRDEETGVILEWLGTSTDVDDMRAMQESQAVLVVELQHRTRNLIAVVSSIVRQTMAQTGPTEAFQRELTDRLEALSRVQGLLSRAGDDGIAVREVVELELKALGAESFGGRVRVEGPDVPLRKSIVQTLALAIHELATNARKYGALKDGRGELTVRWTTRREEGEERRLFFEWLESGVEVRFADGAAVTQGGGYGRRLIEKSLPYSLKAKTSYDLGEDGLRCTIDLPLAKSRKRSRQ